MGFKFWTRKGGRGESPEQTRREGVGPSVELRESAKSPMEEEIKKLWERLTAAEGRVAHLEAKSQASGSADAKIQTLTSELKHHGIHSILYVEPEPSLEYGAEAQGNVGWTERNDGTSATV